MSAPAATRLDRETVVRTAADLADQVGWGRLTMSLLARELDRHVSTLYAHVESLAELRREVAALAFDELTEQVWRAALGRVQRDALAGIAEVYVGYASEHPGRVAAMNEVRTSDDENADAGARLAEAVRATFRSFGLDEAQAAAAHHVFSATINGLVRRRAPEDLEHVVSLFTLALESGSWP